MKYVAILCVALFALGAWFMHAAYNENPAVLDAIWRLHKGSE